MALLLTPRKQTHCSCDKMKHPEACPRERKPNLDLAGKSFILRFLLEDNKHNTTKRFCVKSFKGKSSLFQLRLCFGSFLNKHSFIRDLARPEK